MNRCKRLRNEFTVDKLCKYVQINACNILPLINWQFLHAFDLHTVWISSFGARLNMSSMLTFLSERRLRWLDHVRRMRPVRIPKDLVHGELAEGSLLTGRLRLRFKKKRHETAVSMSAHGISVRLTLQPGALLSERVYRGPRKRETKTSLKSGPGGRRDNDSLSRHRHSPAANTAASCAFRQNKNSSPWINLSHRI